MNTKIMRMMAALAVAFAVASCGGDKQILNEAAEAMTDDEGMNLSYFGQLEGVEYYDDDNTLCFETKNTKVNPALIRDNFDTFAPILINTLFAGSEKRRSLIAQKVSALGCKVEFDLNPEIEAGRNVEVTIPADKYKEYNGIIVDANAELSARMLLKDSLYSLPIMLQNNEQVVDVALENGDLALTIAIDPQLIPTVASNGIYFKQHGMDIIHSHFSEEGTICASGNKGIVLHYVGRNGRGSADVVLSPAVVAKRLSGE